MAVADSGHKIAFQAVQKRYPAASRSAAAVEALAELDLSIAEAEIYSIVGPTGCGKTTTLNLIAGFEQPSDGQLLLHDQPVAGPGPDRAVVFQQASLFPWFSVQDNVTLGVKCQGMDKQEYRHRAARLLEAVGLTGFERHYPYQLSGGMQQRVQIARALIANPDVLLMDEPFGALDYQTRILMQQLLLELWEEIRPTIFFITHDVSEALFISDRVGVMSARPGRLKLEVSVEADKPRNLDFLTTKQFTDLEHDVLASVQEEIGRTHQAQGAQA